MSASRKLLKTRYLDTQSLTASFNGAWFHTENLDDISFMMNIICTANNGQFYIDVSNDLLSGTETTPSPAFYDTILFNGSNLPALASANLVLTAAVQLNCFALARLRFVVGATHTDGTITCDVIGKGV